MGTFYAQTTFFKEKYRCTFWGCHPIIDPPFTRGRLWKRKGGRLWDCRAITDPFRVITDPFFFFITYPLCRGVDNGMTPSDCPFVLFWKIGFRDILLHRMMMLWMNKYVFYQWNLRMRIWLRFIAGLSHEEFDVGGAFLIVWIKKCWNW